VLKNITDVNFLLICNKASLNYFVLLNFSHLLFLHSITGTGCQLMDSHSTVQKTGCAGTANRGKVFIG